MAEAALKIEPAEPTVQDNDDLFSAAFAQISAFDNQSGTPKAAEKPQNGTETVEKAAEKPQNGTETVETGDAADPEADPIAAAAAEGAVEPVKEPVAKTAEAISDDDIVRRLAGLMRKGEPAPVAAQAAVEPVKPPFTPEEAAVVEAYINDFPDVARAEAMIRRSEYQAVTSYIFAEVARELQPLVQTIRTLSERTHLGDLQAHVPDYGTLREQVIDWVGKQPAYLKSAYEHVVKQGTVADVADLVTRFKKETGSAAAPAAVAAAAKPAAELPAAAQKAIAALAPVGSKRSTPVVPIESSNFDDAFSAFAKEL